MLTNTCELYACLDLWIRMLALWNKKSFALLTIGLPSRFVVCSYEHDQWPCPLDSETWTIVWQLKQYVQTVGVYIANWGLRSSTMAPAQAWARMLRQAYLPHRTSHAIKGSTPSEPHFGFCVLFEKVYSSCRSTWIRGLFWSNFCLSLHCLTFASGWLLTWDGLYSFQSEI